MAVASPIVALQRCRIVRAWDDRVEVVVGSPEPRVFPRRVTAGLGVCLKPAGRTHGVIADGRSLRFPAQSICVRPPGCAWSCDPVDASFVSIDVDPSLLPEEATFASMSFLSPAAIDVRTIVARVLDSADALGQQQALVELVDALAEHGLVRAHDTSTTEGGEAAAMRARERLAVGLDDELSLDELARAVGCNKFLLLRAFRRRYGITPHAMRVCLRIDAARTLLARGEQPADVAAFTGFADQSHFGRHFKRIVGLTPAAYRASLRRGA